MRVTLQEAAALIGKTPRQVRYLIKQGSLAAEKVEGRWLIEREVTGRAADRLQKVASRALADAGDPVRAHPAGIRPGRSIRRRARRRLATAARSAPDVFEDVLTAYRAVWDPAWVEPWRHP